MMSLLYLRSLSVLTVLPKIARKALGGLSFLVLLVTPKNAKCGLTPMLGDKTPK